MTAAAPAPLSRRQLWVFTAAAVSIGLGLCLLCAEAALRLAGRRPAYLDAEMYVPASGDRGYGLRPGYRGLYAGGRVTVGPLGLRGETPPGGVLLLGDSAGFGQGLDDDQTLAAQAERLLRAAGRPVPVVNAGVPGYNTKVELSQLKVLLPLLRPRQVVLLYVVDNDTDLRPGVWVRPDGTLDLHLSTGVLSAISRFLTRRFVTYAELRGLLQIRRAQVDQSATWEARTPFAADDPGWRASREALVEMHALLRAAGVPFAVGGIALVENLGAVPQLAELCRQQGIPYATLWQTRDVREFVRRHAVSRTDSHAGAAATAEMARALLPPGDEMTDLPTIEDIETAAARIAPFVRRTPTVEWRPRPRLPGLPDDLRILLKLEQLQLGGSFKLRGASSALLGAAPGRPVYTASGGNHGIGVALAARERGAGATVYLPETAPRSSEKRLLSLGARVLRGGASWDDAWALCTAAAREAGGVLVHPFDDPAVIAGQGSVGLELLADAPDLDLAILGVGGGGLLGGVSTVLRARSRARVLGVEARGADSMVRSLAEGRVVRLDRVDTIASTLAPRAPSERTLHLCRTLSEGVVLVSDEEIRQAQALLWDDLRLMVEPAGAAALAALMAGRVDGALLREVRTVALILCGANS